ncbi:hypothetical protein ACKI1J_14855 [Streptomyces scabiei]|uniref:hypothetical protein n=1 Tax=Streptomyces scabiei TaxID=1930 RepID=UPI001844E033|nr:hypothetical protein [Streptomyces sp.]
MSSEPDCIHHLDICPTCHGLRVTRLDRLEGVTSVIIDAGPLSFSGPAEVYIGPIVEGCPLEEAP